MLTNFFGSYNLNNFILSKNFQNIVFNSFSKKFYSNVIGIDLGTTNSCVAIMEGNNNYKVIENKEGNRTTPSIVAFLQKNKTLVGISAKRQMLLNPLNTFYATKRFIGRKYHDKETLKNIKNLPYKIISNKKDDILLMTKFGLKVTPTEIGSLILAELKKSAENYLQKSIYKAIITVPAYFNDGQRQATKLAGKLAGLDVLRIINEPTSASLAYGFNKNKGNKIIAVYDLGGGTFDISILELSKDGIFEVKATNGNTNLGGEDFDNKLVRYLIEKFINKNKDLLDVSINSIINNKILLQRFKEAGEKAKIELSSAYKTDIYLPFLMNDNKNNPIHFSYQLSQEEYENLIKDLIEKTLIPCKRCINDSGLSKEKIDEIIMVGGMTRVPSIRKSVSNFFGKKVSTHVNPDEAVAIGAAIQGGILSGKVKDMLLLDVTPLSLGIETMGGIFSRVIDRNTTIPIKKSAIFSTAVDNQDTVVIKVYQGERELTKNNKLLGKFDLTGIPPLPRGVPKIEVSFEIDANGIVNVSAKDKATNKSMGIKIQSYNNELSEEEIKKIIENANKMKFFDEQRKKFIELKRELDNLINSLQTQIENRKKLLNKDLINKTRKEIINIKKICNKEFNILEDKNNNGDEDIISEEVIKKLKEQIKNLKDVILEINTDLYK